MTSYKNNQKSKTYPFSDDTHRKPQTQISKVFFSVQTRRLHESFVGSNSSLACSRGKLLRAAPAASGRFIQFLYFCAQRGFEPQLWFQTC